MKVLHKFELDKHGVELVRYPDVATEQFRQLQEEAFAEFRPGENAANRLPRGIRWVIYANDTFHLLERNTYSLRAALNPEEEGRVRRFPLIKAELMNSSVMQAICRDVFQRMGFVENSFERAYEMQVSGIDYSPTLAEPCFPSPVAPHQDLIDGAVVVLGKTGPIIGGVSRIYDLGGAPLWELDLRTSEALLIRDSMVLHQVTPIQLAPGENYRPGDQGYRRIVIIRFQPVGR